MRADAGRLFPKPAREELPTNREWFAASTVVTLAMGIGLWEIQGVESILLAAAVALAVGFLSQSRIGGLTGDGMGAIVELSEVSLLFMACLAPTKALFALQQSLF